jgi:hypothetical protein
MSMSATRRLTVVGDLAGEYVIDEELPDGRLLIRPEPAYPAVLTPGTGRALSDDEFADFLAEHDPQMLPPDGEG